MNKNYSLILVPVLLFITACSSHHRMGHGHRHYRSHVSVGVHSGHHMSGGDVVGALIVGGIIGHILTEAAHDDEPHSNHVHTTQKVTTMTVTTSEDELVNGYEIPKNQETNQWYEAGENGECYLMKKSQNVGKVKVISTVPHYMCP